MLWRWVVFDVCIMMPPEGCYRIDVDVSSGGLLIMNTGNLKVFGWWIVMLFVAQINAASGGLFGSFFIASGHLKVVVRMMLGCWQMA